MSKASIIKWWIACLDISRMIPMWICMRCLTMCRRINISILKAKTCQVPKGMRSRHRLWTFTLYVTAHKRNDQIFVKHLNSETKKQRL